MKVLQDPENAPYVAEIVKTLMSLESNSDFKDLLTDFETLNSDPNFLKIFVPALMKAAMQMEKAELTMVVQCLEEAESFVDTNTVPKNATCPLWKMVNLSPDQHKNITFADLAPHKAAAAPVAAPVVAPATTHQIILLL